MQIAYKEIPFILSISSVSDNGEEESTTHSILNMHLTSKAPHILF
jgi:hypothetical protein